MSIFCGKRFHNFLKGASKNLSNDTALLILFNEFYYIDILAVSRALLGDNSIPPPSTIIF